MRAADARLLHLALADLASGTPRQWWHLEIAGALQDSAAASQRARVQAWLIPRLPSCLIPLLSWQGLTGMRPYQPAASLIAQASAVPIALSLLAILAGVGLLDATRQLAMVLLALLGGLWAGWQTYRSARTAALQCRAAQAEIAETLTPSESALGLAALLLAAGEGYADAQATAVRWTSAPDTVPVADLARLGLLAPSGTGLVGLRAGALWLASVAAVAWPCWLLSGPWQLLPAAMGAVLAHFVVMGHRHGWWRPASRTLLLAVALGLLALAWRHR